MAMHTYVVRYRDADPGCPVFQMRIKAYDEGHARERFDEIDDDPDGWVIVSVKRADNE